jgi:hypothetical protein
LSHHWAGVKQELQCSSCSGFFVEVKKRRKPMNQGTMNTYHEKYANCRKRVKLSCPSCGHRVGDTLAPRKMLIRLAENDTTEPADLYIKCGRCKVEIAFQKTE